MPISTTKPSHAADRFCRNGCVVMLSLCLLMLVLHTTNAEPIDATCAVAWNQLVLELAEKEDGFLTLKGVRTAAMMHLAMYDAFHSVPRPLPARSVEWGRPGTVQTSRSDGRAVVRKVVGTDSQDRDAIAIAVNTAAFAIVESQFPNHRPESDALLQSMTSHVVPSSATVTASAERGSAIAEARRIGKRAALDILHERDGDGWDQEAEYTIHPMAPGVYAEFHEHSGTPEGFVFGAGWAQAKPFLLESPGQFRSPPPPEIDSDAYTTAFAEVKEVGANQSRVRTADQSHLAMWWKEFVESSHNRLARELIVQERLPLEASIRLLALLNASIFDAYVCVFDNKFHYNHWRPYTAIRWAAHDGNPRTQPDPEWTNLHDHTYAFPSYPSAHGCASTAAMTVLADTFGDDYAFTMEIPQVDSAGPFSGKITMNPSTRSFRRFSEAGMECALSRVYLGIHFRYDSEEGYALGRRIGTYAIGQFPAR